MYIPFNAHYACQLIIVGAIFYVLVSIIVANRNSLYGFWLLKLVLLVICEGYRCVKINGIIVKSAHMSFSILTGPEIGMKIGVTLIYSVPGYAF